MKNRNILVTLLSITAMLFLSLVTATSSAQAQTYSGEAVGVIVNDTSQVTTAPGVVTVLATARVADSGQLSPQGGGAQGSGPVVGGTINTGVASATLATGILTSTTAGGLVNGTPRSTSQASVDTLNLNVAGATISATTLQANSQCTCTGTTPTCSGITVVTNLVIARPGLATITLNGSVAPNTTFTTTVAGMTTTIIVNEQIPTADGITVNALHVIETTAVTRVGSITSATGNITTTTTTDIIVAQAHSDITCAAAVAGSNLAVVKTSTINGNVITNTIRVTNNGAADATGVVITDILPAGTTLVSVTGGPAGTGFEVVETIDIVTVTAMLGSSIAANGGMATITIVSSVPAGTASGTIFLNTATATATNDATNPNTSNTTQVTFQAVVATGADLAVTKTSTISGNTINNTITVTNNGPDTATNVVITDPLPAGTTFAGATFVTDTGTVSGTTAPGIGANGTITGTLATLPNGGIATLRVTSIVAPGTPVGTVITNTATVASATADPVSTNNTAASNVTTTVFTAPPPQEGYTVCHRNNGSKGQKTITVGSQAAYDAHIKHGDTPGPCSSGS